jgi:hypothetical protein
MAKIKTKTKKPPRVRKPKGERLKQGYIDPAMAPVSIHEIDDAAEDYTAARDARMSMLTTEVEAGATLLALMKSHNLQEYEYNGKLVSIAALEKIRVKKLKAEENGSAEE